MIVTELYNGQGLGNQLWCYVVLRCIAKANNYDFGIQSPYKYKGAEFLNIDFGKEVIGGEGPEGGPPITLPQDILFYYKEKQTNHPTTRIDISKKDINLFTIKDQTKIDGTMQSIDYIQSYRNDIKQWLTVDVTKNIKDYSSDNICIIHIRGGDFKYSSAFLLSDYYLNAIEKMKCKNSRLEFKIITDDIEYARSICPGYEIIGSATSNQIDKLKASHHIGGPIWQDWTILLNAKYIITSASSFSFWPVWLNDDATVIAPMYWADYKASDGYWSCGDSLIPNWYYLHRNNQLYSYEDCIIQKNFYERVNHNFWL
jgi:Glycosyl transferase family 11